MAFTSYLTINGQIHGEVTGGVATGYATDALGSVTATVDSSGNVANTYRYKPYGATLAKTGSSTDPKNQWVGNWGYRVTSRTQSESYVRARHYGLKAGQWTSVDPLWPEQPVFLYVNCSPATLIDVSGKEIPPLGGYSDPRKYINKCWECATAIWDKWVPLTIHYCNGAYAHCMACCVLTSLDSAGCAEDMQDMQNFFQAPFRSNKFKKARMKYCQEGIAIGRGPHRLCDPKNPPPPLTGPQFHKRCHDECSKLHPVKTGKKNPRKDCQKYSDKALKHWQKWGFPQLSECDPASYRI